MYDSTIDTKKHIEIIQKVFNDVIIPELEKRAEEHDQSKLTSPEKETYDEYIPLLKDTKFGTPEYNKLRDEMAKKGTKHHFDVNRHHPEHFKHGIKDMTLIDVLEMVCDWYAASQCSDTGFLPGLKANKERFGMSDELETIIENTYKEYFKKDGR